VPVPSPKAVMQCYGCHDFGHMARNCPNMNKTATKPTEQVRVVKGIDPRSMLSHPVYIKAFVGQKELTFLVDTGCDRSIMPKKLVGGVRIEPADCHLYAANGTSITFCRL